MTSQEILQLLNQAFPNENICFTVEIWSRPKGTDEVSLSISSARDGYKNIECLNLHDGIARLKTFARLRAQSVEVR